MGVRKYTGGPRAYCDLDGVLANYEAACEARGLHPSRAKLEQGLYRNLPLVAGAREGILALLKQGWEVFILSKIPEKNPYAATEKILWLNEHFPELKDRIILSPDKGAVGGEKDVLIDDYPQWANACNFRGTVLHFGPQGVFPEWSDIVAHLAQRAPAQSA